MDAVDTYVAAIESATVARAAIYTEDVVLDATVPDWRFSVCGAAAVIDELGRWFADPGRFECLDRIEIPGGALLRFELTWEERGEPHMCHQAQLLEVRDGRIARITAFCGGRWGPALMAEMGEASMTSGCA